MIPAQTELPISFPRGWGEFSTKTEEIPGPVLEPPRSTTLRLKRFFPFLIIAVVIFIGIMVFQRISKGKSSAPFSSKKITTIAYWGLWEPEEVMNSIIAEWEGSHPSIKVSYIRQSPQEYRERLQSALARDEGPDIFRYHATWLPMFKSELEIVPEGTANSLGLASNYYPVFSQTLQLQGSFYGLPLGFDSLVLFYNKSLLETAGATPPETWDQLRALAKKITDSYRTEGGKIQVAGISMGLTGNVDHWSDILGLMMLQNGADLANPTGALAEDALSFYALFSKADRVWDETMPSSLVAFAGGKTAMMFGYSWDAFEIQRLNPKLTFGTVTVPQLSSERNVSWASFWAEGVSRKSQKKTEAWQFLEYLASEEGLEKFFQAASKTRAFGEIYPRKAMAQSLGENELLKPFVKQAEDAKTWYLCSRTFDNGINDKIIKYFEDAVNAVAVGDQTPKMALSTAAAGVAQILSQYGLASKAAY